MKTIWIKVKDILVKAELNDSPTAQLIAERLPIKGRVQRWGEEIYFSIPVKTSLEKGAREEVEVGELGYWPPGEAFCIFFGPTPASLSDQPRAASPVNIVGRCLEDSKLLTNAKAGENIELLPAEGNA